MDEKTKEILMNQIKRWREKAKAFEVRSSTVEGPMDDILTSKALTLRSCALDIEDILEN